MHPNTFFPRKVRWFKKGYFSYLILYVLKDRSMHGYEISKAVSEYCKGIYEPSPGILYPTLRKLEREGYVKSKVMDGRKIYSITDKGINALNKKKGYLTNVLGEISTFLDDKTLDLIKAIRGLMRTLYIYFPDLTPDKIEVICDIIKKARADIQRVLEG